MIPKPTNKFKDEKGRWLTQAIFYECYRDNETYPPIYTLKEDDYKGFKSIKKIYLSLEDPTEYKLATKYLGGWEHWKCICECTFFKPHVAAWREELEIKMKCKELEEIINDPNKTFVAKKFLINKEWEVKRGRPSKEELARKDRVNSVVNLQLEKDFKLINEK